MKIRYLNIFIIGVGLSTLTWSNPIKVNPIKVNPVKVNPIKVDPVKIEKPKIEFLLTPDDYVNLALTDLETIPFADRLFIRYFAINNTTDLKTTSLTLNIISRSSNIIRPIPVAGGKLVRVDLRFYAPQAKDLTEWLVLWEEFAFDPMFSLLITRDTLDFVNQEELPKQKTVTHKIKIPGPEREETRIINHPGGDFKYPDDSGRILNNVKPGNYSVDLRFKGPEIEKDIVDEQPNIFDDKTTSVIRFNGKHLDFSKFRHLQTLLNTQAPIVDHRYFKTRVLTTIKDTGVFKTIFGGLYYEFKGIKKAKDVLGKDTKATDLDLFFESIGIGNIKAGLTADQQFDILRSDQRVAVFRSKITGKPRITEMHHVLSDKEGNSWGAITNDIKDADIDIGDRGFANLLKPRIKAREALFPGANGFQIATLWNGEGARQDEVPPDVANDHTIPVPFTKRLQGPISCLRCHNLDGSDGWKPLVNDIKTITASDKIDIFDDLTGKHLDSDTIDRLVGLYNGDFSKNLRRARDDQAEIFLKATGPWESSDQTDTVKIGTQHLSDDYSEYNYNIVDSKVALRELGIVITNGDKNINETYILQKLLKPDLRAIHGNVFIPEDPRLAALISGIGINRSDWALVYSFAAERAKHISKEEVVKWLGN